MTRYPLYFLRAVGGERANTTNNELVARISTDDGLTFGPTAKNIRVVSMKF
ncbi:MAG: hypothetical protein WA941_20465 [Nitrososphaeraceae archaeon]